MLSLQAGTFSRRFIRMLTLMCADCLQVQASVLRKSPEIVVATPGRLIDHLRNTQSVGLEDLAVLVLDEADRLLEMGFKEEIAEIVRMTPKKRQTMLFSATLSDQVRKLAALSLRQPVRLAADAASTAPSQLCQQIVRLKVRAGAGRGLWPAACPLCLSRLLNPLGDGNSLGPVPPSVALALALPLKPLDPLHLRPPSLPSRRPT